MARAWYEKVRNSGHGCVKTARAIGQRAVKVEEGVDFDLGGRSTNRLCLPKVLRVLTRGWRRGSAECGGRYFLEH